MLVKTFIRFTLRLLLLGGLVVALRRAFDSGRLGGRFRGGHEDAPSPPRAPLALVDEGASPFRAVRAPGPAPVRVGAADPVEGDCPPGFPVKGKRSSGIFHVPGGLSYDRTVPDRCYATPEDAAADGLRAARR
jgi:hypothetical protein